MFCLLFLCLVFSLLPRRAVPRRAVAWRVLRAPPPSSRVGASLQANSSSRYRQSKARARCPNTGLAIEFHLRFLRFLSDAAAFLNRSLGSPRLTSSRPVSSVFFFPWTGRRARGELRGDVQRRGVSHGQARVQQRRRLRGQLQTPAVEREGYAAESRLLGCLQSVVKHSLRARRFFKNSCK